MTKCVESTRKRKMKTGIIIVIMQLGLLLIGLANVDKKLEKLIELNAPEFINVVPDKPLMEDK